MLAVPVSFLVALTLALLLAVIWRRENRIPPWPLTSLLVMAAVQSVLIGWRWRYQWPLMLSILPVTASLLPVLAWATVDRLRGIRRGGVSQALPAVAIVALMTGLVSFWRQPIDACLATIEAGYGIAILSIARSSPDVLNLARLGDAPAIRPVIASLGALLLIGAAADGWVAFDFALYGGRAAPTIVSIANLVAVGAAAVAVVLVGRSPPIPSPQTRAEAAPPIGASASERAIPADRSDGASDDAVLTAIRTLMLDRTLYRDPDLSLDRLARRAGVPARAVSSTINRMHGLNVSQYVNGFRVGEAQRLLVGSDRPITLIMFEVGFQTKSNFNREFKRVAGCSPKEWRLRYASSGSTDLLVPVPCDDREPGLRSRTASGTGGR